MTAAGMSRSRDAASCFIGEYSCIIIRLSSVLNGLPEGGDLLNKVVNGFPYMYYISVQFVVLQWVLHGCAKHHCNTQSFHGYCI